MEIQIFKDQNISVPHRYFKIFPFFCGCGCGKIAFMQDVDRIGHFDYEGGYWEYFILGHHVRMVFNYLQKHPHKNGELVCPNCGTNDFSWGSHTYYCAKCRFEYN